MYRLLLISILLPVASQAQANLGRGCTTALHIDNDCDGYGIGTGLLGPDADDTDATVHTAAQARAKWGAGTAASDGLSLFLAHLGYTPAHYYYVSTTGNNSTGSVDNPTKPYATISGIRAVHSLSADDIVLVHGGTYTDNWSLNYPATSGTNGHPVIFLAYPGELPVFDLAGDFSGDQGAGNHDVTIDGIKFTNTTNAGEGRTYFFGAGSVGGAARITIRHSEVDNRANGIFMMQGLQDILIEENVFHEGSSHNIYIGCRDVPNSNITVRNNVLYRPGLTCAQHNGRVTNYVLEGNICHSFRNASGFSLEMGVSNSFVRNNLVFDGQREPFVIFDYPFPRQDLYPGLLSYDQTGNTIENNTFVVGTKSYLDGTDLLSAYPNIRVDLGSTEQTQDIGTNVFRNNLLINTSAIAPIWYTTSQCTYTCASGDCTGSNYCMNGSDPAIQAARSTWQNNLVYTSFVNVLRLYNGTTKRGIPPGPVPPVIDISYTLGQANGYTANYSGNINRNPLVVRNSDADAQHPEYYDFSLQAGSAAINAGTPAGAPANDIRGSSRAGHVDIGAYQFAGVAPPPASRCDLNGDGAVDATDVSIAIAQAIGRTACTNAALRAAGTCNVIDVQRVISAALIGVCVSQ